MAKSAAGYRTVIDVLLEMSLRLAQPIVFQAITAIQVSPVGGYGDGGYGDGGYGDSPQIPSTVTLGSVAGVYIGAVLVIGLGSENEEAVVVTNIAGEVIFAVFTQPHQVGDIVAGATFPTQQATDAIFTPDEVRGYLSRAQNEFLLQVPAIYELVQQTVNQGSVLEPLPSEAIQLDRAAISTYTLQISTMSRTGGVLLIGTAAPHGLGVGSSLTITGSKVPSLNGVISVDSIPSPSGISCEMEGYDVVDNSGVAQLNYWVRLYEATQAELTMQDRNWRASYAGTPTAFFEDRSGNHQWGVNTLPQANFPAELLVSMRDDDMLGWTDGFLVPDIFLHYVIYKTFEYLFQKEGVRQNPSMAAYCKKRFDRGVQTANRYVEGLKLNLENA